MVKFPEITLWYYSQIVREKRRHTGFSLAARNIMEASRMDDEMKPRLTETVSGAG